MKLSHFSNRNADAGGVLKRTMPLFAAMALLLATNSAPAQTELPTDADLDIDNKTCQVAPDQFKSWFKNNAVEKDGVVKPADSLHFVSSSECAFYKWSAQMFLWLTSPVSPGRRIFNSGDFFALSAPNPKRTLIRQDTPQQKGFAPSIALQTQIPKALTDSTGKQRPVVMLGTAGGSASPFLDKANKPVEVANVAATAKGEPILLDRFNRAIDFKKTASGAPALTGSSAANLKLAAKTVQIGDQQLLQSTNGAVVVIEGTELVQATGDVLLAKNQAVVLYLLQVNDVFAYFRIGPGNSTNPAPDQLPSEAVALKATEDFASQAPPPYKMDKFGDRDALAVELKSSWVDAESLPEAVRGNYLTISAEFPVYETSGDAIRKRLDLKSGTLALVGFHVVGTTLGHPEMIWATYEHVNNAPNVGYSYINSAKQPATHDKDGKSDAWLFSTEGAAEPTGDELISTATMSGPDIVAIGSKIAPVNVTRRSPWGSDPGNAATNTKIIAINNSVTSQLANEDLRKKYLLIGALWTNGRGPSEKDSNGNLPPQLGTKAVANSTMETFSQTVNCFASGCHFSTRIGVSHVWKKIIPAFP